MALIDATAPDPADEDVPSAGPVDTTVEPPPEPDSGQIEQIITAAVVAGCALFVFWQLQPELIFSNTTPTGGDMGAHVWGPAFLRDELLPRFRVTGWTPDWYSGFPAFQFYMVIPSLAIVILDVGLEWFLAIPAVGALLAGTWRLLRQPNTARYRALIVSLAVVTGLLIIPIPYNVSFKLVAVSGAVLFPVAAWALGQLAGLRFPGPPMLALASLAFLFDRSFNIYGGNIASTLAGEFAASISLSISLVALGLVIRGTRTGAHKAAAAVAIALTGLSHLLPAFFLLAAISVVMLGRLLRGRWKAIPWLMLAGTASALLSAFWVLPFFLRTDYLNDMGWERIELLHSPLVTRSNLNPSEVLSDYPPLPVLLLLAFVGLVLSIVRRVELGGILAVTAAVMAAGFVWFPDGRLWNARILPFYYLCITLLAGLGVALAIQAIARSTLANRLIAAVTAAATLMISGVRNAWVWPEPGADGATAWDYVGDATLYSVRVYATVALVVLALTEIPRQLTRFANQSLIFPALIGAGLLAVSPARDISEWFDSLTTAPGVFWGIVFFVSITAVVALAVFVAMEVMKQQAPSVQDERDERDEHTGEVLAPPLETWRNPRNETQVVLRAAPLAAAATVFVLLGLALNVVGGIRQTDEGRSWTLGGLSVTSNDNSFVPGWARWNFSGLEAKTGSSGDIGYVGQGGFDEYNYVQRTMIGVGQERGCGRAFWEFAPELNRYGTTMAMMLLPLWTDGCIGSMEGLYFEATPTVPYHFLLQTDLSAASRTIAEDQSFGGPSQAMRDLPYASFDIDRGVERMHELGVRYYLAFSPQSIEAARDHPELIEVTSASPWVVFETDSPLIEPLEAAPVVLDGVRNHQDEWLDVGVEWFQAPTTVRPASSGPDEWTRIEAPLVVDRYKAPDTRKAGSIGPDATPLADLLPPPAAETPVAVSDVRTDTDRIRFHVDQIGTPVLVRTSYFPNWSAKGAEGPYRVAPNFMVVVPTELDVELKFGRTAPDWLALGLTAVGLIALLAMITGRTRTNRRDTSTVEHDDTSLRPAP